MTSIIGSCHWRGCQLLLFGMLFVDWKQSVLFAMHKGQVDVAEQQWHLNKDKIMNNNITSVNV